MSQSNAWPENGKNHLKFRAMDHQRRTEEARRHVWQ
jgi:hypothetical protein